MSNYKGDHPRPLIGDLKPFALALASAVTVPSADRSDWVARKGPHSIFQVLAQMLPEVRHEVLMASEQTFRLTALLSRYLIFLPVEIGSKAS